jgi:hypothetical protein
VRHPLTRAVAAAVRRPRPDDAAAFLALLDSRLKALERVAGGGEPAPEGFGRRDHALARRFLHRFEPTWDDGDENLVRGYLDRWARDAEPPARTMARSLVFAASELSRIEGRPGTLFFFLWEMESMLTSWDELVRIPAYAPERRAGGR